MDLNRHTSSDEKLDQYSSENFGFGQKSEVLVSPDEMLDHIQF